MPPSQSHRRRTSQGLRSTSSSSSASTSTSRTGITPTVHWQGMPSPAGSTSSCNVMMGYAEFNFEVVSLPVTVALRRRKWNLNASADSLASEVAVMFASEVLLVLVVALAHVSS